MSDHNEANVSRFDGFAELYDQYRPQPPVIITGILTQWLGGVPELVVDIGCGTGLSTRIWQGLAASVIGIEPNNDMRAVAQKQTSPNEGVLYEYGTSTQTGLPNESADIVCISQAFHWMEPTATLAEVARILKPGGIFAVIDCDWPPTMNWQAERLYRELIARVNRLEHERGIHDTVRKWPKSDHFANIQQCGQFRYTKEITVHNIESGGADRFAGLLMSQGGVESLLKLGISEHELGIDQFRQDLIQCMGDIPLPWYVSYRVRLGVK